MMFLFSATSLAALLLSILLVGDPNGDGSGGGPPLAQAFNLDTKAPIVHTGPGSSYFGYTVALHRDGARFWLLVGAPKATTDQPNVEQAGAVFRCGLTTWPPCSKIPFDPNGHSTISVAGESVQSDSKSHQWFGGSLQSSPDNGTIIACAPKYVYFSANRKRRDPVGNCWISRGSFDGFGEYSPCRINDQYGHHHLGSCEAGFASAITKDGGKIFMAAPGAHVWQGQVFERNLRSDLSKSTSPVNPHYEDDSYLGYSLALGRFSARSSSSSAAQSDVDVAIGMPRGNDLAGKIVVVDRDMKTLLNITGEQMGAYFGYALAVADVNGDKLDDLIIGAPLFYNHTTSHKEAHFERGRVYVALQNGRHEFKLAQRIDGRKNRARFGTSLANCGDLNRDGVQDVAVGAPYDGPNNQGAIYIYMGRRQQGLSQDYDQAIYAETIYQQQDLTGHSFGFSLSGGLDVDANQYPDLLVGDYQSDRAVLLRARPVANVTATISFQPENFNLDDRPCQLVLANSTTSVPCITVQFCTRYTGLNVDQSLSFSYDIKLDADKQDVPRLFLLDRPGKSDDKMRITLSKDESKCKSFKAYIMREIRDKLTPLKVEIEYSLMEPAAELVDSTKLRPVINRLASQSNKLTKVATILKNCGPDNVCVPDLKLTMAPNLDSYTIGNEQKLVLDVAVRNNGEDAFESMFYLQMPMTINFESIENRSRAEYPICYGAKPDETGVNVLTCDLGNPLARNDVLKFSVVAVPVKNDDVVFNDFTFKAEVNSSNPEADDKHREDNTVTIGIPIRVDYNLVLSGNSQPPSIMHNMTLMRQQLQSQQPALKVIESQLGPEVWHNYQLQNKGPSRIKDIAVTVLWPTRTKNGDNLLYLVDEPKTNDKVKCKPAPANSINPLNLKYVRDSARFVAGQSQNPLVSNQRQRRQATAPQEQLVALESNTQQQQRASSQLPSSVAGEALAQNSPSTVDENFVEQIKSQIEGNAARHTIFECNVHDLGHNDVATIKIRSRLDSETVTNFTMEDFDISSRLIAQIKSLPTNTSLHTIQPYTIKVDTLIHTTGLSIQDRIPWWLIILAILLGILLFGLLACFLKYLGFFTRRRPPKTAEREPLTPTIWNDYRYTPGDTAL